jgi:chromate transporter
MEPDSTALRPAIPIPGPPPSLAMIAWVFMLIGMQSFGGGLSAWMRREAVQRRRWMSEQQFASGMALCQIAPGPNSVNLSVFIGTTLRGRAGALAALLGMLVVPVVVVVAMGGLFARVQEVAAVNSAMVGLGAGAIGMNLAMGVRMIPANIGGKVSAAVALAVAASIGLAGLPLLPVLLVMLPVSLLLAGRWR